MIEWSLPGNPPMLIVGGSFSQIGSIVANNIAAWDGQHWHGLGDGIDGPVRALAVYNNILYAGGSFMSPGRRLVSWNGSEWAVVADVGSNYTVGGETVHAMAIYNGELCVAGRFAQVNGDQQLRNSARYNGSSWQDGPTLPNEASDIHALQVFDDDGSGPNAPALYVGGDYHSMTKWDGATETDYLLVGGATICAFTLVNPTFGKGAMPGGLVVGGNFHAVSDQQGGFTITSDVAIWTGAQWHALDGGVGDYDSWVNTVRAYGSDLYVGGVFDAVDNGAVPASNIARFVDGLYWSALGGGVQAYGEGVTEMRVFNNMLMVGGEFGAVENFFVDADNLAKWNVIGGVGGWSAFSEPVTVNAAGYLGSRLVVGGSFAQTLNAYETYNLLTWDGQNQGRLGWGTNGPIRALVGYTSGSGPNTSRVMVAGGEFTTAGGGAEFGGSVNANRVAQWIEPAFDLPRWEPMGAGFNNFVYALERFNGNTIAGGSFNSSGATILNRLAKWAGSPGAWQPLGGSDIGLNGDVRALKSYTTNTGSTWHLVIGGDFTSAPGSGVAASRILQRTEDITSSSWVALGAGFNGPVMAIERHGGGISARTYAAGAFTHSGGTQLNRIARFTGNPASWQPVGTGVGFNNSVFALKSVGGFLYAAGAFTSVDGVPANHVARWNGSAWSDASGGANDHVHALLSYQNELIAGGKFTAVQSGNVNSPAMARLLSTGAPWVAQHPVSTTPPCGHPVHYDVAAAEGYEVTYQWRRDGAALTNGLTGTGSFIGGVQTSSMFINHCSEADNGAYDCVISNDCGSATSAAAILALPVCCPADIAPQPNGDGVVNVTDLLAVIGAWGGCPGGCPPPTTNCPPDITQNCIVNVQDLLAVIGDWGFCP